MRFSLYLALPLLLGAAGVELIVLLAHPDPGFALIPMIAGTVAAYIVGLVAIFFLLRVLGAGRFYWFGAYCVVAGAVGVWYF